MKIQKLDISTNRVERGENCALFLNETNIEFVWHFNATTIIYNHREWDLEGQSWDGKGNVVTRLSGAFQPGFQKEVKYPLVEASAL